MANTIAEAKAMLPITEEWLRNEWGWTDADFEAFGEDNTQKKAAIIAKDILDIQTDVSFDFGGPSAPSSADECAEWAAESLWDGLGWDQFDNPQFVRFDEHPEWDDATINALVKQTLEEKFEEAGIEWWEANTSDSYF